jgi:hypothetical protein
MIKSHSHIVSAQLVKRYKEAGGTYSGEKDKDARIIDDGWIRLEKSKGEKYRYKFKSRCV